MIKAKETWVTALALFSLFFGAGNLILPPLLGFQSGTLWWLVTLGFCLSAVLIPILGILAHAKLQGTIFDLARKCPGLQPGVFFSHLHHIHKLALATHGSGHT